MRHPFAPLAALLVSVALTFGCSTARDAAPVPEEIVGKKKSGSWFGGEADSAAGGFADERQAANQAPGAPPATEMEAAPKAQAADSALERSEPARSRDDGSAKNDKAEQGEEKAKDASAGMYIIRRASLTIQVPEVKAGVIRVSGLVKHVGGFVAESAYEATEGQAPSARMTLRVPAEKFDVVLDQIGGVGTVFARNVDSDDVTLEFVDTTSRVRNLRKEEDQLIKLLQRTGKLLDVLTVERELARVRGEIEQAQGRLRHLGSLVDLATIEVTLSEKVKVVSTSPWGGIGAALENAWADAERGLASTVEWVLRTGVWLFGYFLPVTAPVVLIFVLVGVGLRKWLVDTKKVIPATWFQRFWIGLAVAIVAMYWPPLAGLVIVAAIVAGVIAVFSALVTKFFVRKRELD